MTAFIETALLTFDVDPALVGDLFERHHRGRSTTWLATQAVMAILAASYSRWTTHKVLTLRGLLVGAGTVALLSKLAWFPMLAVTRVFGITVGNYLLAAHHDTLRQWFMVYQLYNLPVVGFTCVTYAAAGRAVARASRESPAAILLFAIAVQIWWTYGLMAHIYDAMQVPKMNLYPYIEALAFFLVSPSIMTAVLTARRRHNVS
jgi:hypothetical protein